MGINMIFFYKAIIKIDFLNLLNRTFLDFFRKKQNIFFMHSISKNTVRDWAISLRVDK